MIYYTYVYLVNSQNRLVISESPITNSNYVLLLDNNGPDRFQLMLVAKFYCIGIITGGNMKRTIVNDFKEFI